jgi:hypothetical protein
MALKKKKPAKKKTPRKKQAPKKKPAIKKKPASRKKASPKKKTFRKAPAKKRTVTKPPVKKSKETIFGEVTHYFPHVRAAVVKVKVPFTVGDSLRIKGHTTDFVQTITSMQIDRTPIQKAKKGDEIGLLVDSRVRAKDIVLKA